MKRLLIALLLLPVAAATAQENIQPARDWAPETLEIASKIAVQNEGRIKPLSTMAAFSMLRIHHKRTFTDSLERRRKPTEWLLDTLFYPKAMSAEKIFLVQNSDALDALDLNIPGRKRRDRYSYDELAPARARLIKLGHQYDQVDAKERNPVQSQIVLLLHGVLEYESLLDYMNFARYPIPVPPGLEDAFPGQTSIRYSEALTKLPELASSRRDEPGVKVLQEEVMRRARAARALALFPPTAGHGTDQWMTAGDVAQVRPPAPAHLKMVQHLEELLAQRDDPAMFQATLTMLKNETTQAAEARGEYGKIGLEVFYYRLDAFYRSLVIFLFTFLLVAGTWIWPASRWLNRGAWASAIAALSLLTFGIVLRCILRGRPPVSTLYETVLFITATGVLSALIVEAINRKRIAMAVVPVLGALGLFLAMRFEEINRADTMPQLQAVLDTNFWLSTHVTCITYGYAAGLLAAAIAHIYILGKAFGLKRGNTAFYRELTRITYGILAVSLMFSVVGTILGGVWANESWGRFWGWDPKENGALMIVLAQLAILHGRMGGYLRELGIAWAAIAQGIIVSFSWWGVNLLGVGLHSYGFTDGVWTGLMTFWGIETTVLMVAGGLWIAQRARAQVTAAG